MLFPGSLMRGECVQRLVDKQFGSGTTTITFGVVSDTEEPPHDPLSLIEVSLRFPNSIGEIHIPFR
jgi:hypothetical protein